MMKIVSRNEVLSLIEHTSGVTKDEGSVNGDSDEDFDDSDDENAFDYWSLGGKSQKVQLDQIEEVLFRHFFFGSVKSQKRKFDKQAIQIKTNSILISIESQK